VRATLAGAKHKDYIHSTGSKKGRDKGLKECYGRNHQVNSYTSERNLLAVRTVGDVRKGAQVVPLDAGYGETYRRGGSECGRISKKRIVCIKEC